MAAWLYSETPVKIFTSEFEFLSLPLKANSEREIQMIVSGLQKVWVLNKKTENDIQSQEGIKTDMTRQMLHLHTWITKKL